MEDAESEELLEPVVYYGVSPEIRGNGAFIKEHSFAHLSGRLLITEQLRTRKQSFWHLPKYGKHIINAVAFDKKREILVVADEGDPPTLCAYRLEDHQRLLYFSPRDTKSSRFSSVFVHCDSDRVSALLAEPDNLIYTFFLDDGSLEAVTKAMHNGIDTHVTQVVGHHEDTFHYAILGLGIFRFMMWMGDIWEDVFRSFNDARGIPFSCGVYASYDTIAAGTTDGRIFIISHDGIKAVHSSISVERIYIEVKKKGVKPQPILIPPKEDVITDGYKRENEVKFLQRFTKGLVYCVKEGGRESIHMFLKGRFGEKEPFWIQDLTYRYPTEGNPFPKHGYIRIPVGQVKEYDGMMKNSRPLFNITNLTMTHNGKCIVLTFSGRFFMILESKCDINPPKKLTDARYMSVGYNTGPIDHVATCLWKHIFVTVSDRTLKLYDYHNRKVYCAFTLQDYIYSISLHPSGFYGMLGLTDKAVLFSLNSYSFNPMMEFSVECCKSSVFSEHGHLVILAEEERLRMYSVYSFQHKGEILDGHAGKINYMWLCPNNAHLWTCRTSGIICQTNMADGVLKYLFQSSPIKSFTHFDNYRLIYVTTYDGILKEIDTLQDQVTMEADLRHGDLAGVVACEKRSLLIVATETGYVLVFRIPWNKEPGPLFKARIHYAPLCKIAVSRDENFLLTSAKDGSVCLWKIKDYIKPEKWEVIYSINDHYPCRANFKTYSDFKEIKTILRLEADYFKRQEKLISFSTLDQYMTDIKSVLSRMKDQLLEKNLYESTRYKLLELQECRNSIDTLAKDFINETEFYFDRFIKNQAVRMRDEFDVDKAYGQAAEIFHNRYIEPLKQMFDKMKEYRIYLTGTLFHDVRKDITEDIRNKVWFMKHHRKKAIKRLKEIISKGQNLLSIKSSPKFLMKIRKMRRAKYRAKELMRSSIHKEIVMIITIFRMIQELKRIKGERVKHPYDSDNEASLPFPDAASEKSCISDTFSLIHSDSPFNPLNLNRNLAKRKSPPNSPSITSDDEAQNIVWPPLKMDRDYKELYQQFMKQSKIKSNNKPLMKCLDQNYYTGKCIKKFPIQIPIRENKLKDLPGHNKGFEKVKNGGENLDNGTEKEIIIGKSSTIEKEKVVTKIFSSNVSSRFIKRGRLYDKAMSNLRASRKRQKRLEAFIGQWEPNPNETSTIPLKKPLTQRNYAFILKTNGEEKVSEEDIDAINENNSAIVKKEISRELQPSVFQVMYNLYIHPETIVKQVSPFHFFKRKITKSKFKSLLLKYSPSSRLSSLATKHLISSQLLRTFKNNQAKRISGKEASFVQKSNNLQKITLGDIIDYDLFSDGCETRKKCLPALSAKDSFFSISSLQWENHNEHSESLSSLQALSNYSKSTLPDMVEPMTQDDRRSKKYGSPTSFSKAESLREVSEGKESQMSSYISTTETFKSSRNRIENIPKNNVLPVPSNAKSKRWKKVKDTIYNESEKSDSIKEVEKLLRAVTTGEKELPSVDGIKAAENQTCSQRSSWTKSRVSKQMTEKDILMLKKLNVIKEKDSFDSGEMDLSENEDSSKVGKSREKLVGKSSSAVASSSLCSYDPLELTDLLQHEKEESSFVRMGKLERIAGERVKYDIVPERQWRSFDPPISKNLMNTLLEYDLLKKIQKYSSASEHSSDQSECLMSDSEYSSFDLNKVRWKDSDTDAWKKYFLDDINADLREEQEDNKSEEDMLEEELIEEGFSGILDEELSDDYSQGTAFNEFLQEKSEKDSEEKVKGSDKYEQLDDDNLPPRSGDILKKKDSERHIKKERVSARGIGSLSGRGDKKIDNDAKEKEIKKQESKMKSQDKASEDEIQLALETEEKQVEEYLQFLKKFKSYFLNEELFPCIQFLASGENDEDMDEQEELDIDESVSDEKSTEKKTATGQGSDMELSAEQTDTELEELQKDGRAIQLSKPCDSSVTMVCHDGVMFNKPLNDKAMRRKVNYKCSKKSRSINKKEDVVGEVWRWWYESLCVGSREKSYSEDRPAYQGKLQTDGKLKTSYSEDSPAYQGKLQTDGKLKTSYSEDSPAYQGKLQTDGKKLDTAVSSSTQTEDSFESFANGENDKVLEDFRSHIKYFTQLSKQSTSDALISSYNIRLWKKLFPIDHPKTIDSYEKLSENLQKRKQKQQEFNDPKKLELPIFKKNPIPKDKPFLNYKQYSECKKDSFKEIKLKSNSEISFARLLKRSQPKEKEPDAPSDEIESISSPSYIVHMDEEDDKCSLYMRQTVRIKTRLKNKIWFVPERGRKGEFTKGRFYYPGEIWTKGRTSLTLRYSNKIPINHPRSAAKNKTSLSLKRLKGSKSKGKKNTNVTFNNNPILTKDIELSMEKPNGLGLLKENLNQIKFIRINMPFGPFYILPFRSKKFWDRLARAVGNRLAIKLRSEVIMKSHINKNVTDICRKKVKPLEAKANIDSSGDVELKVISLQKLPSDKKEHINEFSGTKIHKKKHDTVSKHGMQLPLDDLDQEAKEKRKELMQNLVSEFFPKAHHGSFYKKIRMNKWIFLFNESHEKNRAKFHPSKTPVKYKKTKKMFVPLKNKYLEKLNKSEKHSAVDNKIKEWVGRHVGHYCRIKDSSVPYKEAEASESRQTQKSEPESAESKKPESSQDEDLEKQSQKELIEPPDELTQKLQEWMISNYKFLRKKVKVGKPFSLNKELLQFGVKHNVVVKRNIPHTFVEKVKHFDRAIKRSLKSLGKRPSQDNNKKMGQESRAIRIKPSLRTAKNIVDYYTQKSTKGKNTIPTDTKNKLPRFYVDSQEQIYGEKRWKDAMYPSRNKKEIHDIDKEKAESGLQENVQIETEVNDWHRPVNILNENTKHIPLKPYLKIRWPYSILKMKTQVAKKIMPSSGKRKYEEPLAKCISLQSELLESNRRRVKYKRVLRGGEVVERCGRKLDCLRPEAKPKLSGLPTDFNLAALDSNYHYLKRIKQHFFQRNIHDIKNYYIYVHKIRGLLIEEHDKKMLYNRRQDLLNERFEEFHKFNKEYNLHKTHMMQWKEKLRKEKININNAMKNGNAEWNKLEKLKMDIHNTIDIFYNKSKKKYFKTAVQELIEKYLPSDNDAGKERNIMSLYKEEIVKQIKSEVKPALKLREQMKNPKIKALNEANRYVKFAHNQRVKPKETIKNKEKDKKLYSIPLEWGPYKKLGLKYQKLHLENILKEKSTDVPHTTKKTKLFESALFKELSETLRIQNEEIKKLKAEIKIINQNMALDAKLKPFCHKK